MLNGKVGVKGLKEEEPCNTVTLFCNLLLEFFLNQCKKVGKSPKFRKNLLLKFDLSFLKN